MFKNHFVVDHLYNLKQTCNTCPICSQVTSKILDHMLIFHPLNCAICSQPISAENQHFNCLNVFFM